MCAKVLALAISIAATSLPYASAQLAAGHDKYLGSILDGRAGNLKPIPPRFHELFNQVSPENAGKWGYVEAERDVMDWSALDEHYAYARDRGMPFLLHSITRREQEPNWLRHLPPDEIRAEVEEWIAALAARYPDVALIDVVNEAPHGKLGSDELKAAMGGKGATGWDDVVNVYKLTRQYFPNAILLLNDYSVIEFDNRPDYDELARVLEEAGVLDALGLQGHFLEGKAGRVKRRIDEVTARSGIQDVYITEFDLNVSPTVDGRTGFSQLTQYQQVFRALWEHPAVKGITLWGYVENNTWLDDAFLLYEDGRERPALGWLREYLTPAVRSAARLEAEGRDALYGMTGFDENTDYLSLNPAKDSAYVSFRRVDLAQANNLKLRFRAGGGPYTVSARLDAPGGPEIATYTVAAGADADAWRVDSVGLVTPGADVRDVFVTIRPGSVDTANAFALDYVGFGPATVVGFADDLRADEPWSVNAYVRDGGTALAVELGGVLPREMTFALADATGRVVWTRRADAGALAAAMLLPFGQPSGVYFLVARDGEGHTASSAVVNR